MDIVAFEENLLNQLKDFALCQDSQVRYEKIIALGKALPPMQESFKTDRYLVQGCQSRTHLHAWKEGDLIRFEGASEALISSGLLALLLFAYDGQPAEVVLSYPPTYLQKLGMITSLSPGRANGLISMYAAMKREAIILSLPTKPPVD